MRESTHHSFMCRASSSALGKCLHANPTDSPERMTGLRIANLTPTAPDQRVRPRRGVGLFLGWLGCLTSGLMAAEPAEVQRGMLAGNYAAVIKQARGELRDSPGNSEWSILLVQALLTVGKYGEADAAMKEALARDARSIRLRWLAREVAFANGRPDEA